MGLKKICTQWNNAIHKVCTICFRPYQLLLLSTHNLMDICFLTCICLWQISHIQTRLFSVVGPGLVSTSPAFVSSSASHPAGPHGRHAQKTVNRAPIAGGGRVRHNLHSSSCMLWQLHHLLAVSFGASALSVNWLLGDLIRQYHIINQLISSQLVNVWVCVHCVHYQ